MDMNCPICLLDYDHSVTDNCPHILICGHSLCLTCLRKLKRPKFITCPICKDRVGYKEAKNITATKILSGLGEVIIIIIVYI